MSELIKQIEKSLGIQAPSPETRLSTDWLGDKVPQLFIKRDDLLHPVISGNKWRKLKYAIEELVSHQHKRVLSFGGGFSNHLHALGYCCYKLDMKLTAVVRGDYSQTLSPMLLDLINWGVDIQYVDRKTYQQRSNPEFLADLARQHRVTIIPEGGSQTLALKGVAEIISELGQDYDHIFCPVGSGGTLAGLITGNQQRAAKLTGVAVLKGKDYLEQLVTDLYPEANTQNNWQINHDYHFGGYGKRPQELIAFCHHFSQQSGIEVEPVYSGKLAFALCNMFKQKVFNPSDKVLMLHTGGLQGARQLAPSDDIPVN